MSELVLTTSHSYPLRELVQAALETQQRVLQAGIQRTEERLRAFEAQYGLSSAEFLRHYEADEFSESLDFAEWIGEMRLLERMRQKLAVLKDISIAN